MRSIFRRLSALSVLCLFAFSAAASAQSAAAVASTARVIMAVDPAETVRMKTPRPEWATAANDLGVLQADKNMDNLHLFLQRSPQVQAAMDQMLLDLQDPNSPRYHQWLTPQQTADQFGIAPTDLAAVTQWLQSQGLHVDDVAAGGVFITFSGPVSAVQHAFSTELHSFAFNAASQRYASTQAPAIPAAISSVVQFVGGLDELYFKNYLVQSPARPMSEVFPDTTGQATPLYSLNSGAIHWVSPGDFSLIYDINSIYSSGISGSTSRVAILGGSRTLASDITNYETLFTLPALQPNVVILPSGSDPGLTNNGNQAEATLDVDRVLATAPGAGPDLLITANALNFSVTFSLLQYNISTLNDPIVSMSFGACEFSPSSQSSASQFDSYYKTGTLQGIGYYVSSGDTGAASCDPNGGAIPASQVLAPNLLCASQYATCVGGTEYADFASPSSYWSATNSSTKVSALGYIPEGAWNEPSSVSGGVTTYQAASTGGGASITFGKPTWQTGTGVPNDGARDTPDISFGASGHNAFALCYFAGGADCSAATGNFIDGFGGTSASAPSMAGIAALLNQKLGARQGNLNPLLYKLAATTPNAFHDITAATSGVSGCVITTPSMCNNSTPSPTGLSGGLSGYPLNTGYDLVTGLGSLDVANFFTAAIAAQGVSTTLVVTAAPNPVAVGTLATFTATLTPGASSSTPTGTVSFYSNGALLNSPVTISGNKATTTFAYGSTGTYAITATYSGDATFSTSSAPSYSLVVSAAPGFTLTPASPALNINSGATTGNTDLITVTAASSFSGTVGLTCTVTNLNGTAAGTCSLSSNSVALTPGASATSLLTVTTTPGTSGALTVAVNGTNGSLTQGAVIQYNLAAGGFTLTPSISGYLTITAGATTANTETLTVVSTNGFAGNVALTCSFSSGGGGTVTAGNSGCTVSPSTVTLTAGGTATSTITVNTTAGTSGQTVIYSIGGTGTTAGATLPFNLGATFGITVITPGFTLTGAPASISLPGNATTGNTFPVTITSTNAYAGPVTVGCSSLLTSVATCTGGTANLTAGGTASVTVTVSPVLHSSGSSTLTISGTGTPTGQTVSFTAAPVTVAASIVTVGSTLSVTAVPATVVVGNPSVLTAVVTPSSSNGAPTGSVTFTVKDPTTGLTSTVGSGTLSASAPYTATVSYTPLNASATAFLITATYAGDSGYATSTNTGNLSVTGFSATPTAANLSFTSGATTGNSDVITFTSIGSYTGTIALTCSISSSNAASQPTCSLNPASVTVPAGGSQITTVTIGSITAHNTGGGLNASNALTTGGATFALLLCLMPFRRRKAIRSLMVFVFLLGGLSIVSGCGGGGTSPTPLQSSAGNYIVTVSGTGTGVPTAVKTSFNLTIN